MATTIRASQRHRSRSSLSRRLSRPALSSRDISSAFGKSGLPGDHSSTDVACWSKYSGSVVTRRGSLIPGALYLYLARRHRVDADPWGQQLRSTDEQI